MRTLPFILLAALVACSPQPRTPLEADRALSQALRDRDTTAVLRLVDDEATWTDASGRTLTKSGLSTAF